MAQAAFERVAQIARTPYRAHPDPGRTRPRPPRDKTKPLKISGGSEAEARPAGIHEAIGAPSLKRSKLEDALSDLRWSFNPARSASAHTNVAQVLILMSRDDEARSHLETALGWIGPRGKSTVSWKLALNRKELSISCGVSESLYFATE